MESPSQVNRIHCSLASARLLRKKCPHIPLTSRGKISIKGKGHMKTYFVNDQQHEGRDEGTDLIKPEIFVLDEETGNGSQALMDVGSMELGIEAQRPGDIAC